MASDLIGRQKALLLLEDGTIFEGYGFGYPTSTVGEVVFNTGMVGYTEALTDPSYRGQILCFTYPLIGNYGVPSYTLKDQFGFPIHFESERIQVSGVIAHEICFKPSHSASAMTIHEWLYSNGIPGVYGIDTRRLTAMLRVRGVMMGALEVSEEPRLQRVKETLDASKSYGEIDFVEQVSVDRLVQYGDGKRRIALIDCGTKLNIIRELLKRGFTVLRLPYNSSAENILKYEPSGVVFSNGPGDPKRCATTVEAAESLVELGVPFLGICLGNQIVGLALGGDTFKLKYGHRGQNKPCVEVGSGRSYVTSQNHGYAVDPDSLEGTGLKIWFLNADDSTVEGLKHTEKPCIAVQFHPEASPGPFDTIFVFDTFIQMVSSSNEV